MSTVLAGLDPDFVANASVDAIRTQYERAQRTADMWNDRARALFLLLGQREDEASASPTHGGTR
ncbi:hypothetical protein DMH25_08260 [Streptomyces sp. WAC 01325]|uniref:hypothetical protein n=1 Tax=Streptomyces sp. WAC 01325 TaxID=2203202 RepID=UPI000F867A88|nr:hypothetical protein [Streptomyces sp. WAC 01325]RSN13771.1 hypothetical protein DMH25_08260 [Streptomyces sp. WAC 01325]